MRNVEDRKVILITGASSGIGQAAARLLHKEDYRVFGTSRHPKLNSVDGFEILPLEVTSDESVANCVQDVLNRTGNRIDVLINNVGTGILGAAEESSVDQVRELFDINFFGAVRMTNAVLPFMRKSRDGKILFMSSAGGVSSIPYASYYCATKHALEAYVEGLRLEIEQFGILAALIAPGTVNTSAGDKAMQPDRPIVEYSPKRIQATNDYVKAIHEGMEPNKVAGNILEVIKATKLQPRYTVGGQSRIVSLLKRFLPARIFESGVRNLT